MRRVLPVVAALALAGCPKPPKPPPEPVELVSGQDLPAQVIPAEGLDRLRGRIELPVAADLIVVAEPVSPEARFVVRVFPPEGGLPLAEGPAPLALRELAAGRYVVEVQTTTKVATRLRLRASVRAPDPEEESGPDATAEGAAALVLAPVPGVEARQGSAGGEVDFDRRDRTDWHALQIPEAGRLNLEFRLAAPRARVVAAFGRTPAEIESAPRGVGQGFSAQVEPGTYYVRVQAAQRGEASAYTLTAEFKPPPWIEAAVVEFTKAGACTATVDKGTNHQVRTGAAVNVFVGGQLVSAGVVEQAFAQMSRVKVFSGDCRLAGGKVRILAD